MLQSTAGTSLKKQPNLIPPCPPPPGTLQGRNVTFPFLALPPEIQLYIREKFDDLTSFCFALTCQEYFGSGPRIFTPDLAKISIVEGHADLVLFGIKELGIDFFKFYYPFLKEAACRNHRQIFERDGICKEEWKPSLYSEAIVQGAAAGQEEAYSWMSHHFSDQEYNDFIMEGYLLSSNLEGIRKLLPHCDLSPRCEFMALRHADHRVVKFLIDKGYFTEPAGEDFSQLGFNRDVRVFSLFYKPRNKIRECFPAAIGTDNLELCELIATLPEAPRLSYQHLILALRNLSFRTFDWLLEKQQIPFCYQVLEELFLDNYGRYFDERKERLASSITAGLRERGLIDYVELLGLGPFGDLKLLQEFIERGLADKINYLDLFCYPHATKDTYEMVKFLLKSAPDQLNEEAIVAILLCPFATFTQKQTLLSLLTKDEQVQILALRDKTEKLLKRKLALTLELHAQKDLLKELDEKEL